MKISLRQRILCALLVLLVLLLGACSDASTAGVSAPARESAQTVSGTAEEQLSPSKSKATVAPTPEATACPVREDGVYTAKDDVALYIHLYGHLPSNFITKDEAEELGWTGGGLDRYAPGCSIGGDRFGNREGLLPKAKGRTYTECDIDTMGARSRGAKRIVFSNDGLVYYTDDHYASFTLLYGEE